MLGHVPAPSHRDHHLLLIPGVAIVPKVNSVISNETPSTITAQLCPGIKQLQLLQTKLFKTNVQIESKTFSFNFQNAQFAQCIHISD